MITEIIKVDGVSKSFQKEDKKLLHVLETVDLSLKEGEIVALLGKSGSGKSTLLRIIAGLIDANTGSVKYRGKVVSAPVPDISMVFQSFALMPWLTVMQNVEIGLEARKVNKKETRNRALKAIDLVGLDGFENAYPRELSGGMKQRVGFARALVLEPEVLLMDEPFSALDILTAENLREDLLEMWEDNDMMKSILYVTHSIEEAVLTADRIIIFGNNPGFIRGELKIDVPHPRNAKDVKIIDLIDEVYSMLTTAQTAVLKERMNKKKAVTIGYALPQVEIAEITGLLDEIIDINAKDDIDLRELADEIHLDISELFPILEVLSVLRFAEVSDGDVKAKSLGRKFSEATMDDKKHIFAGVFIKRIPLASHVVRTLQNMEENSASKSFLLSQISGCFIDSDADKVFNTFVEWARYAELIVYDATTEMLSLDDNVINNLDDFLNYI